MAPRQYKDGLVSALIKQEMEKSSLCLLGVVVQRPGMVVLFGFRAR